MEDWQLLKQEYQPRIQRCAKMLRTVLGDSWNQIVVVPLEKKYPKSLENWTKEHYEDYLHELEAVLGNPLIQVGLEIEEGG